MSLDDYWFPPVALESMQDVVDAYTLAPVTLDNSNVLEWIRFDGHVSIIVSYEPRDERVGISVLPGPVGEILPIELLIDASGLRRPDPVRVRQRDEAAARAALKGYQAILLSPEFSGMFQGDERLLDKTRALAVIGPSTPRYEWPDPFPHE